MAIAGCAETLTPINCAITGSHPIQKTSPAAAPENFVRVPCDLCAAPAGEPFLEKFGGFYTRCGRCGFIYANPRARDPGEWNEFNNDQKSAEYVSKHYSVGHQRGFASLLRQFEKYRRTGRILEIGCSAGGFLFQARERGWKPTGIEPVGAVARFGKEKHGLDVRICLLEEAALEANSFDVVYTNAVLEHLPSPSAALRKVFEVLRPGGLVFADTVNYESYTQQFIGAEWKLIDPRAHLSLFSPATLRSFCEKSGLTVLKITTNGVRFRPNKNGRLRGARRWLEEVRKLPFSLAARFTLRGDGITVWAQKPPA